MKPKITFAVIAMAISLTGIIILQLYWIDGAIKVRSKQFDGQVFDAINEVTDKLQIQEAMTILPKILPGMDSVQRKTVDSFYTRRLSQHHYRGRFGLHLKHIRKNFSDDPFKNTHSEEDTGLRRPNISEIHKLNLLNNPSEKIMQSDFMDSMMADSGKRLMAKANMYSRLLKRMIVNYINENKDIQKRISKPIMDSLLKYEFKQRGIDIPYVAAIYNKQTGGLYFATDQADTISLKETSYKSKLFPDDMVPQPYYLIVDFPDKRSFVLRSIGLVLPGSFAFMLIIIVSCAFTVYMLLKQKKLSEMKNDFINNMTHEFKTPIATISLATDAISNPRVMVNKDKLMHYNSIIKEENNRMNIQVQKVLNAALMDKEDFKLNLDSFDAQKIVAALVERFYIHIHERNGSLTLNNKAEFAMVYGDEVHFGNVINNLLDNANKYSPGPPVIKVSTYNDGENLVIEVEDHGIGIAKEVQKRIFDKFFRMSTGNIHSTKGFGLGLSYVKAVVTAQKGTIEVKSEPKKGSIFTIRLPLYHYKPFD